MLSTTKEKVRPDFDNIVLISGNAYGLPFQNHSFNFVSSSYVLDLLLEHELEIVLNEL